MDELQQSGATLIYDPSFSRSPAPADREGVFQNAADLRPRRAEQFRLHPTPGRAQLRPAPAGVLPRAAAAAQLAHDQRPAGASGKPGLVWLGLNLPLASLWTRAAGPGRRVRQRHGLAAPSPPCPWCMRRTCCTARLLARPVTRLRHRARPGDRSQVGIGWRRTGPRNPEPA